MAQLHRWSGLLLTWLLFVVFLTGTLSFFRQELTLWMQPERPLWQETTAPEVVVELARQYLQQQAPDASRWSIGLPGSRDGLMDVQWQGEGGNGQVYLHPLDGKEVKVRGTRGGDFFYRFHFQLHYLPVLFSRYLVGIAAMLMLVALISGVITHKKIFQDFFAFRWGKGQRSWMDAHNGFSVLALPFHLMITYTGLVALMMLYIPWGMEKAFPEPEQRQRLISEIFAFLPAEPPGAPASLTSSLSPLLHQARSRWGDVAIGRVEISHPGKSNAKVLIEAQTGQATTLGISGHPPFMVFDGGSGELLRVKEAQPAYAVYGTLLGLHLGRFADGPGRWLYALLGTAGCGMLATGLILWTTKRRKKPGHSRTGLWLVERLNLVVLAGFPVAVIAMFWLNRLLPPIMPARAQWEIHGLFLVWLCMLLHALLRPLASGWREQLGLAGMLLLCLPLLNMVTTDRGLLPSLLSGDWVFVGVDLTALILAGLMFRLAKGRPAA